MISFFGAIIVIFKHRLKILQFRSQSLSNVHKIVIATQMEETFSFAANELDNSNSFVQEQTDAHFMTLMRMIHTSEFSTRSKDFFGVLI